jgi:hypothetical protein
VIILSGRVLVHFGQLFWGEPRHTVGRLRPFIKGRLRRTSGIALVPLSPQVWWIVFAALTIVSPYHIVVTLDRRTQ